MAERPASESTYAGIVRLVEAAQAAKAPMVRLADRYALVFLAVTVALAGGTWFVTGDHIRMLAVLVSATPCPLILAVPVAIISGMGKAARRGVLMKGGAGAGNHGAGDEPRHRQDRHADAGAGRNWPRILPAGDLAEDEMLRLAASLEQASAHVTAASIVEAAHERGLRLSFPQNVRETAGEGLTGEVEGQEVVVGGHDFVARQIGSALEQARPPAGHGTGRARRLRPARRASAAGRCGARGNARRAGAACGQAGIRRIVLASGDAQAVVDRVGGDLGLDMLQGRPDARRKRSPSCWRSARTASP